VLLRTPKACADSASVFGEDIRHPRGTHATPSIRVNYTLGATPRTALRTSIAGAATSVPRCSGVMVFSVVMLTLARKSFVSTSLLNHLAPRRRPKRHRQAPRLSG